MLDLSQRAGNCLVQAFPQQAKPSPRSQYAPHHHRRSAIRQQASYVKRYSRHQLRLAPCNVDRSATPAAELEPQAGTAAVDRSETLKVHMLSILEEDEQIKLSNMPKELEELVEELKSVPEDQRKEIDAKGIKGSWVSRVQTTNLINEDGKVDLGTLSFQQWKPSKLQLKVDDHVGGVQIGVDAEDQYQIDTCFTIQEGPLQGQRAVSSALGRFEVDKEKPARQTIFFTGLRLQPAPGTDEEARRKWVEVMKSENEGMDDRGVKEMSFPEPIKGFRDFLLFDRSIQVSLGNRGSLTILVPKQSGK